MQTQTQTQTQTQKKKTSGTNALSYIIQLIAGIGGFIMFCKYLDLFFKRKTDATPFLMSKNWMISATAISACIIIAGIIIAISLGKTLSVKTNSSISNAEKRASTKNNLSYIVFIIGCISALISVIAFPLFLTKVISQENVVLATKIISVINAIAFAIGITIAIAFVCCCCCANCCAVNTNQSAVKNENSDLIVSEELANIDFKNEEQSINTVPPTKSLEVNNELSFEYTGNKEVYGLGKNNDANNLLSSIVPIN